MAINSQALSTSIASDAEFRTFCQNVETALAACGLIRTSDTGQTDLTTVAKPSASWTFPAKRMWRFNDAEQATNPVFLLFEFGTSNNATVPSMRITWGTGTDGACALTGNIVNVGYNIAHNSADTAFTGTCRWCGDGSRLAFSLWQNSSQSPECVFSIERSGDGCVSLSFSHYDNTAFRRTRWLPYAGSLGWGLDSVLGFHVPEGMTTGTSGNTVYTWGFRPYNPAEAPGAGSGILLAFTGDLVLGNTYSVDVNGSSHTYLVLGPNTGNAGDTNAKWTPGNTAITKNLLIRWE